MKKENAVVVVSCNCFCSDIELSELNQGDEQFCHCYKVERKFSWFCDLLFKNNILDLILFDIFLEILTIGFERKLNNKLEENDFIANFITLMIYLILFLIFSYINRTDYLCSYKSIFKNKNNKKELDDQVKNLVVIGFFDFIFVTIFSGFSSLGKKGLKNFTNNYLIIFPYALTKFYYFVLMNCLVNIIDSGNVDLLSNSSIVSFFLLLYKLLSTFIIDILLGSSADDLILFQFIIGVSIIIIIISLIALGFLFAYLCVKCIQALCNLLCESCCKKKIYN